MQGGRERAREMIVVGFALLTAGAHAGLLREARAADARPAPVQLRGDHAVHATDAAADVELALRSGFAVRLRRARGAGVALRVAKVRASAGEIDATFVPIGPTVQLSARAGRADVSFVADQFRVRQGQRLVLAVEQPECTSNAAVACSRWRLAPASYEAGRCLARGVEPAGLRLQFGSLVR